jgi:hypothetical protein
VRSIAQLASRNGAIATGVARILGRGVVTVAVSLLALPAMLVALMAVESGVRTRATPRNGGGGEEEVPRRSGRQIPVTVKRLAIPIVTLTFAFAILACLVTFALPHRHFEDNTLTQPSDLAPSFSSEGGTSLQLHALAPGAHVAFERTNLQLVASTPTAVRLADQSNPTWTVAGQNEFAQTIAGLQADRVYDVFVDGRFYEHVQADASGTAAFQYDGDMSQPRTFELRPG